MNDLQYHIQELFIDGYNEGEIAKQTGLPYDQVIAVLRDFGVDVEEMNPYNTINS